MAQSEWQHEYKRADRIERLMEQKRKLQNNEIEATQQKINAGLNELNINRDREFEKLYHKSEFLVKNLKGAQVQEVNYFKKDTKLGKINTSVMGKTGGFNSTFQGRSSMNRSKNPTKIN